MQFDSKDLEDLTKFSDAMLNLNRVVSDKALRDASGLCATGIWELRKRDGFYWCDPSAAALFRIHEKEFNTVMLIGIQCDHDIKTLHSAVYSCARLLRSSTLLRDYVNSYTPSPCFDTARKLLERFVRTQELVVQRTLKDYQKEFKIIVPVSLQSLVKKYYIACSKNRKSKSERFDIMTRIRTIMESESYPKATRMEAFQCLRTVALDDKYDKLIRIGALTSIANAIDIFE